MDGTNARSVASVLLCAVVGYAAAAATRASAEAEPAPPAEILARGDGFTITVDEFRARMAEQSEQVRAKYATPAKRREFLDSMIRFEVLVAEARRQGMERDPVVVLTLEKVMVQRLVQLKFAGPGDKQEKTKAFDEWLAKVRARSNVVVSPAPLDALPDEPVPQAAPPPDAAGASRAPADK